MGKRSVTMFLLITLFWILNADSVIDAPVAVADSLASGPFESASGSNESPLTVTLQAGNGNMVPFKTQNGRTVNGLASHSYDLPHLVLHRNDILTKPEERSLTVTVAGIELPSPGITLTLFVETQHGDPTLGGGYHTRITVWNESRWLPNSTGDTQRDVTAQFTLLFDEMVMNGTQLTDTPTDYFRYELVVYGPDQPAAVPLHSLSQDYAFLMENQWLAPLPEVREASPGASPDELAIHYNDMFPYHKSNTDPVTWMHRADVTPFVQHQLVPALVEAYRLQSDEWGFPWYREWTSYREDIDDRRLSVALAAGKTWYHGRAPAQGHSGITLQVAGTNSAGYDTMLEGLVSTFHHELFHNHQRNLSQHLGSTADITGAGDAWAFFTEGTAILASSAGWSPTHFGPNAASHSYFSFANAFLGSGGLLTSLNSNYQQLSPYRATIYWRFLYEQCGGLAGDFEDPATGMAVIRHALITLYSRQIVDITTSTDLVGNLPAIMDRALAQTATCPFSNYEQSLLHFAQALYALRLAGGRCVRPGFPAGCGFYDPHKLYARPAVDVINYDGTPVIFGAADQMYPAGIRSSFGIDFIEVVLSPSAHGRSLTVEFDAAPGSASEFRLCLWKLRQPSTGGESVPVAPPEILTETSTDGHVIYTIPAIDISQNNRLGFIITRVDAAESEDRIGMYTIRLSR